MASLYQDIRRGATTGKRIADNVGEKVSRRMAETAALKEAVRAGDLVTRDEIVIERMGRRHGFIVKLLFFPALLTLFWDLPAFLTTIGLWVWSLYLQRCKITEMVADVPVAAAEAWGTLRGGVTAAIVTVLALWIMPARAFWVILAGGWGMAALFTSVGMVRIHSYFGSRQVAEDPVEVEEVPESEDMPDPEELEAVAKQHIVYGLTKPVPYVFDVPEGLPAGIAHRDEERYRHAYIIGKTRSGKSYFLRNAICQDIHSGAGVIVLTHERTMFEDYILPYYPSERIDDLVYFNPADTKGKIIGFNIFELNDGESPAFKAGEIYTVFERTIEDIGQSMRPILQNAIDALVYMQAGKTLRDLRTLIDPEGNQPLVSEIARSKYVEEETKRFWANYANSSAARTGYEPLKYRLRPLLQEPLLTTLSTASFNVNEELNRHSRVLCIDLSELRGPQQKMVGQMMIALLRETFSARDVQIKHKQFLPYFWYIDEFQQYAGDSSAALLEIFNGLRKYNIGLTIAHQTTANLKPEMLHTIMGNVGTVGAMRLQESEANYFARELQVKEVRQPVGKKKETVESVRAKYHEVYQSNNPKRTELLQMLQNKIKRLELEAALHEEEDEIERDPAVKLRPDLFLEETMPQGHMILRGSTLTQHLKKGAIYLQVPAEPVGVQREEIFEYDDYVMSSQEKYGKELPPPEAPPEDEFMVTT
jgi:hypothetical protein